jgi:hypothetical protein
LEYNPKLVSAKPESMSFESDFGMRFISSGDSERNRERMHFIPPQSPLFQEQYANIAKSVAESGDPKQIFLRNGDDFTLVGAGELRDMVDLPKDERRKAFFDLSISMFWSEEVIIENVRREEIGINNVPQAVLEPPTSQEAIEK